MDYQTFKDTLDDYLIMEYGSIDVAKKYDSFMQTAMNDYMNKFCLSFVNNTHDLKLKQQALAECKKYMNQYTRELRK